VLDYLGDSSRVDRIVADLLLETGDLSGFSQSKGLLVVGSPGEKSFGRPSPTNPDLQVDHVDRRALVSGALLACSQSMQPES
jgi:hypothetical protein